MDTNKLIKKHNHITDLISGKQVRKSISLIKELIEVSKNGDHGQQLENIENTYKNMVKYTIEGVHDPERHKVLTRMLQSLLELSDKIKQDILARYSGWHTYWLKDNSHKEQSLAGKSIIETIDDLAFKEELDTWLRQAGTVSPDPESDHARKHSQLVNKIFNHLWLTDKYGEAENELIKLIMSSGKFEWYEQSLFVSAITLSTLRFWDPEKIQILTALYRDKSEQISERALAGFLLVLYSYNRRIVVYPEVKGLLAELSEDPGFTEHLKITILQIIRSGETEKISKKLHDEILPRVAELRPRLEDKLDLDNLLPEDLMEGKNPDWSDMFKESEDLFKTMEEFSRLQMEGADVYMSAFANLKNFDFFRKILNWFMPFYPDHEAIDVLYRDEVLGAGTNELAEALYKTPFICNSDKYSLVLNLQHLPASQKEMMLKVFRMELEGLEQMRDAEIDIDPTKGFKTNVTQYLQDLYRFFKLSPYKKEFDDVFRATLDFHQTTLFRLVFRDRESLTTFADYYFGKDLYNEALDLYSEILNDNPDEAQLYEKAAYCYQQLAEYEKALDMYGRAEMLDRKIWTLKKIGFCNRRLGKHGEALDNYLEAEKMDPGNMHTTAMIGHCHLDMEDYDSALKYYFKVEYNDPDNTRILKPIAWCYLVQGKYEQSKKYFDKINKGEMSGHDYINAGHLALCMGDRMKAIDYYRRSIIEGKMDKSDFLDIFNDDAPILISNNIDPDDLPIITDYLFFDLEDQGKYM
ncbi:MAG: tetratricopeptide repeat protein [Bacteroidales bacterium]|nr:tetratricopeptide repeat protein [Bacteroidales bacterium]